MITAEFIFKMKIEICVGFCSALFLSKSEGFYVETLGIYFRSFDKLIYNTVEPPQKWTFLSALERCPLWGV